MVGKRTHVIVLYDKRSLGRYDPGDIGRPFDDQGWFIACPVCGGYGSLKEHTVTENEDGTLTISPSLLCYKRDFTTCAHYYVEHNRIRWA